MVTPPPEDTTPKNTPENSVDNLWKNREFRARILSAAVLAPIVLGCIIAGGVWFYLLMILTAIFMMREWDSLTRFRKSRSWGFAGVAYVTLTCLSLIRLRENALDGNLELLLFLVLIVWATDIGAYFAGKLIGGPKLIPAISPKKTWAGLLGGMGSAMIIACFLTIFFSFPALISQALWMGPLLAIVSQAGDIFESWMKRKAGVKDSGTLIPGHGGILDRVDGFTFSAPLMVVLHIALATA